MRAVLLHGFAGDVHAWDPVLQSWRANALPDPICLPGHGGGEVQHGWDANLEAVSRMIGDPEVVIGYSLGARIALGLLATDRCRRAVLISVNPGIDDVDRPARREHDAKWTAMLRTQGIAAFADAWEAQPLFASQGRAPFTRRDARRRRRLMLDPEQLALSLEHMGLAEMPDYRGEVERGVCVVGAEDTKFVGIAKALRIPYYSVSASGHDPTLEQPTHLCRILGKIIDR